MLPPALTIRGMLGFGPRLTPSPWGAGRIDVGFPIRRGAVWFAVPVRLRCGAGLDRPHRMAGTPVRLRAAGRRDCARAPAAPGGDRRRRGRRPPPPDPDPPRQ